MLQQPEIRLCLLQKKSLETQIIFPEVPVNVCVSHFMYSELSN